MHLRPSEREPRNVLLDEIAVDRVERDNTALVTKTEERQEVERRQHGPVDEGGQEREDRNDDQREYGQDERPHRV